MPTSFKNRLWKLPTVSKLVLAGSFLAIVGVFLPWYNDIDKFGTGDMFLGISGPLYLAGIIVLLSSISSFFLIAMRVFNRPIPKLPMKEEQFYVFSGSVSIAMLLLSVSVFFHNKFGISLVDKNVGIGMYLGFFGAGLIILGAIVAIRNREVSFETEGNLEPLIEVNNEHRESKPLDLRSEDIGDEAMKVKSAVQESIDDFTDGTDTKDIQ